jgi:hypothetical protein
MCLRSNPFQIIFLKFLEILCYSCITVMKYSFYYLQDYWILQKIS